MGKPLDWDKASKHLNEIIKSYHDEESAHHLMLTILPLSVRYKNGERTRQLYFEIMGLD